MPLGTELCELIPLETLEKAYQKYISNINKGDSMEYTDTHCWTFTPESFQLILLDLFFLKLINFFPINVNSGENSEFLIKLEKRTEMDYLTKNFTEKEKKLFYAIAYHSDQILNFENQLFITGQSEVERTGSLIFFQRILKFVIQNF